MWSICSVARRARLAQRCARQCPSGPWPRDAWAATRTAPFSSDKPAGSGSVVREPAPPQGGQGAAAGDGPGSFPGRAGSSGSGGIRAAWAACSTAERWHLFILFFSGAALNLGMGVVIPALPALSQDLGFGAAGVGVLLAAPGLARVLCNLPAGALADRHGRVPCMAVGELAGAVGCLGTALGGSLGVMAPFRFLGGAGGALSAAGTAAYLADMTERPHLQAFRGAIVGAQGGLVAVSYVVGPAIGGFLTELYGAQATHGLVAGLILACAGAYTALPETRPHPPAGAGKLRQLDLSEMLGRTASEWRALLRDSNQQALFAANVALCLNYAAVVTVLPMQAFQVFGTSPGDLGVLFSAGSCLGVVLSPVAGSVFDAHGRVPFGLPAMLACALGCAGVASMQQWEWYVAAYMLWSFGEAVLAPLLTAYAVDVAPKECTASALALARQAGDLTFFLAPPVLGFVYDAWPGQWAMAGTAALTVLCSALFRRWATEAWPVRKQV